MKKKDSEMVPSVAVKKPASGPGERNGWNFSPRYTANSRVWLLENGKAVCGKAVAIKFTRRSDGTTDTRYVVEICHHGLVTEMTKPEPELFPDRDSLMAYIVN